MRPYPLTSEELVDDLASELREIIETVQKGFGTLSRDQLAWHAGRGRWGVGHCLVHVARTNELYRGPLSEALRTAKAEGRTARGPLRGRWFGRLFTRAMGPGGPKVRTKDFLKPRYAVIQAAALETFLAEQIRFEGILADARGLDLDAVRVVSPVSGWIRLGVGDAMRALVAHERRHLAQAERVLAMEGFPR